MQISNKYIVVEKFIEEKKEGFQIVEIQDNYVYKGKIKMLPEISVYIGNKQLAIGDIILFAKYSPDTQEIEIDNNKLKFIRIEDILLVE